MKKQGLHTLADVKAEEFEAKQKSTKYKSKDADSEIDKIFDDTYLPALEDVDSEDNDMPEEESDKEEEVNIEK
ncbi:hypothetical protein GJ744_007215 [Endocarpon pusillum]|uniref:Uncharacterized protein n=1 Tax=Endocarpon pusillum TaxID=364733 RepID=A0A8H7A3S4_9EURO|nr:hypothetical protein GJ744_007215 [Endocarpon pusillum]